MKNLIYAISLLLSFLVILSHEMIPHHHHAFGWDEFSGSHNDHEQYAHHKSAGHHHHDTDHQNHNHSNDPEKENNHKFPFHHHISPTEDYDYLRIRLDRNISVIHTLLTDLDSFFETTFSEPPELDFSRFTNKPFFITFIFEPGAIGLRAPPAIA